MLYLIDRHLASLEIRSPYRNGSVGGVLWCREVTLFAWSNRCCDKLDADTDHRRRGFCRLASRFVIQARYSGQYRYRARQSKAAGQRISAGAAGFRRSRIPPRGSEIQPVLKLTRQCQDFHSQEFMRFFDFDYHRNDSISPSHKAMGHKRNGRH